MKKVLFVALCLLCSWSTMYAQYEYTVETFGGDVQYKTNASSQWQAVHAKLILSTNDSIWVKKGGFARIEYGNHPYEFTAPCISTIGELVKNKRTERSKHFSAKGLLREIGSDNTQPFQMKQVGAGKMRQVGSGGTRGDIEIDIINYEALADTLTRIGAMACAGGKSPKVKGLVFVHHKPNKEEVGFDLENHTDKDYHMNVLHINKRTKKISLCYVVAPDVKENACPITPSGFCSCDMDIFFPDTKDDMYVLIALDYPYDSQKLDDELFYHRINEAKNIDVRIKYTWSYE